MSSPSSAPRAALQTMNPDPQHVTMETYWREVSSIEEETEGEEEDEEERKSVDEVELEEVWLTGAGLSSLLASSAPSEEEATASPPPLEVLLSTLTRQQTATVRRRLDNYQETLRKTNRQPARDVRDIFTLPDDDTAESSSPPGCHQAESPKGRYHTTTKTIRRSSHTARLPLHTALFEDDLPKDQHTLSSSQSHSPSHTHSHHEDVRQADWLLHDTPYSEGVADHRRTGMCWLCQRFHGVNSGDLPLELVLPSRGLTSVDDLSSADLKRLGFICHIELSTFLLALGVHTKRTRTPRRRSRDGGVFGVPLNTLLENDRKKCPGVRVPIVFQKLLCLVEQRGLQTEGILRVSGSAARLKHLRRELDRCCGGFDWSAVRQVEAAGLLKLFIRELPTPLLTHTHMANYHAVLGVSSEVHQIQALQLLTLLLPESHRDTLRALLMLLRQVVSHQQQNRMSLWNVSMVMAPNLFAFRRGNKRGSGGGQREEVEEAVGGAHLVRLMISHQELLWTVPNFLLSQVRQMNQASNQRQLGLSRARLQLLRRKNDRNHKDQITELCEDVIRVHAPLHTKVSTAIQLDGQLTAKDVTARFSPAQRLYEVGGNICERRLHPDCVLLDVHRVNPHCDWLIKP